VKYLDEKVFRKNLEAIQMHASADGQIGKPGDFPNLLKLQPLLMTDALINAPGPVFYTAVYQIIMSEVQGAAVSVNVKNIDGLNNQVYNVPPINSNVLGGFFVSFSWKLFWPRKYTME
jgi:hypothetical protein